MTRFESNFKVPLLGECLKFERIFGFWFKSTKPSLVNLTMRIGVSKTLAQSFTKPLCRLVSQGFFQQFMENLQSLESSGDIDYGIIGRENFSQKSGQKNLAKAYPIQSNTFCQQSTADKQMEIPKFGKLKGSKSWSSNFGLQRLKLSILKIKMCGR